VRHDPADVRHSRLDAAEDGRPCGAYEVPLADIEVHFAGSSQRISRMSPLILRAGYTGATIAALHELERKLPRLKPNETPATAMSFLSHMAERYGDELDISGVAEAPGGAFAWCRMLFARESARAGMSELMTINTWTWFCRGALYGRTCRSETWTASRGELEPQLERLMAQHPQRIATMIQGGCTGGARRILKLQQPTSLVAKPAPGPPTRDHQESTNVKPLFRNRKTHVDRHDLTHAALSRR
jgi:hypothetical protein